jgi:uncharacterized membrane protein YGL010W
VLSYITVELVSLRGKVTQKEHDIRERLHRVPKSEIDAAKLGRTLFWPKLLIVFGIVFSVLLYLFYVVPYQQATGEPATGEILMSVGVGLSLVVTGVLAWWGTARSYRLPES